MKPRIFISSTIYDFKDLRSSLKYYLEQYGYEVQLSEYNDFTKKLEENSYKACLDSISISDYFILIIGYRTGGFYDRKQNISITQKEYQTAYEYAITKKMKIISFVRDEIWIIKEDRKALEELIKNNFLTDKEIDEGDLFKIPFYKSNFVNDASSIFNFIDEITRKDEMKKAINGEGNYPINNWVHPFKTFRDITDVINIEFNIKYNLFEESIRFNLKNELFDITKQFYTKINGKLQKQNLWGTFARKSISKDLDTPSQMKYQHFKWLSIYALLGTATTVYLGNYFIDKALESGIFLEFDNSTDTYKQSKISRYLIVLKSKIERLKKAEEICKTYYTKLISKYDSFKNSPDDSSIQINNIDIFPFLASYDLQEDVLNLSSALFQAIDNDFSKLDSLILYPQSPFEIENERMEYENPTDDDIREILK